MLGDHSRIHVIHGGIDTDRFHPLDAPVQRQEWGLTPEHFAFGVVGGYNLPRGKGQREFLQAAARISGEVPEARFVIVGRGNLGPILRADIERLGLAGKAWMTPYCQDMTAAMNALDCLVHPQVGTEAFPGVVLEAFACGKPVIASALDGIPEGFAVGGCGKLVAPEDVPALAAAMLEQPRQPAPTPVERQALYQRVALGHSLPVWTRKVSALYGQLAGL
jgi:glycosyltransferase involved in cell wall biosynthesis